LGRHVSKVPPTVVGRFSEGIGAIMVISQLNVLFGVPAPGWSKCFLAQLNGNCAEIPPVMRVAPLFLGCVVMITRQR